MKFQFTSVLGVFSFAVVGCTSVADQPAPSAALRDLGLARFEIVETQTGLTIDGRAANDTTVASLELSVGTFYMDEDDRGEVDGRRLDIHAFGQAVTHESEGYDTLSLPLPRQPLVSAFLVDPTVTNRLARWGINLDVSSMPASTGSLLPQGESSFVTSCGVGRVISHYSGSNTSCQTSSFGGCDAPEWKRKQFVRPDGHWGEYRCCPNEASFNERLCIPEAVSGTDTVCGKTGPLKCAVCWTERLGLTNGENITCDIDVMSGGCYASYCLE